MALRGKWIQLKERDDGKKWKWRYGENRWRRRQKFAAFDFFPTIARRRSLISLALIVSLNLGREQMKNLDVNQNSWRRFDRVVCKHFHSFDAITSWSVESHRHLSTICLYCKVGVISQHVHKRARWVDRVCDETAEQKEENREKQKN